MEDNSAYYDEITHSLSIAVKWGGEGLINVPNLLKKVIAERMWKKRFVVMLGQTVEFERFEDFVFAQPPEGIGTNLRMLKNLCHFDSYVDYLLELTIAGIDIPSNTDKSFIETSSPIDDSRRYLVWRLLEKGSINVVHQLLTQAITPSQAKKIIGVESLRRAVQIDDPYSTARTLRKFMLPSDRLELARLLLEDDD